MTQRAVQAPASRMETSWASLWNTPRSSASIARTKTLKPTHSHIWSIAGFHKGVATRTKGEPSRAPESVDSGTCEGLAQPTEACGTVRRGAVLTIRRARDVSPARLLPFCHKASGTPAV